MKCPTCFSIMRCISEIYNLPGQPGRRRMNLCCVNRENDDDRIPNRCQATTCWMTVITEDPKPWICHSYGFNFRHDGTTYELASNDRPVDSRSLYKTASTRLYRTINMAGTMAGKINHQEIIQLPYFMPLSTDNDMHERAWELFYRLLNMSAFG